MVMNFDWQTAAAALAVLAALAYVARMAFRRARSMTARGVASPSSVACGGCEPEKKVKSPAPAPKVLVQIGRQRTSPRR